MQAIKEFLNWFNYSGHWVYASREAALSTWQTRGIEGLDDAPMGVRDDALIVAWLVR